MYCTSYPAINSPERKKQRLENITFFGFLFVATVYVSIAVESHL
jgi:hypothetical protein